MLSWLSEAGNTVELTKIDAWSATLVELRIATRPSARPPGNT